MRRASCLRNSTYKVMSTSDRLSGCFAPGIRRFGSFVDLVPVERPEELEQVYLKDATVISGINIGSGDQPWFSYPGETFGCCVM